MVERYPRTLIILVFGLASARALGDLCIHSINLNEIRHNTGKVITKYLLPRLLGLTLCRHLDPVNLLGQVQHSQG